MKHLIILATLIAAIIFGLAAPDMAWAQSKSDIFEKPWRSLDKTERGAFFRATKLDAQIRTNADWLVVERQPLTWSPGADLVRVHGAWQPANLFLYYLKDKTGRFTQLDGNATVIHAHNRASPPKLTAATVKDYLWFFGFFVRGEEGPFLVVETGRDRFLPKGISKGQFAGGVKTAYDVPRPMVCSAATGKDLFSCDAVIMYSNAIFAAKMMVEKGGMVRMAGDTPIATDLNLKIDAPITLVAASGGFVKPRGPATAPADAGSIPAVTGLPADAERVFKALSEGKPLTLDGSTTPFLAGMAASMLERCGLPKDGGARIRLQAFTASSAISSLMGSDYSNPNIGTALGSAARQQALFAAGAIVTGQIGCGPVLDGLGMRIAEIVKANSAQGSRFVDTCASVHGKASCTCLANLARPVIPDIAGRTYHRNDIDELIKRNPMTGLMVAISCGISRY
jgi:hypothetical protein